jgi:hypothetical protein
MSVRPNHDSASSSIASVSGSSPLAHGADQIRMARPARRDNSGTITEATARSWSISPARSTFRARYASMTRPHSSAAAGRT